jgi:hypothetical protein
MLVRSNGLLVIASRCRVGSASRTNRFTPVVDEGYQTGRKPAAGEIINANHGGLHRANRSISGRIRGWAVRTANPRVETECTFFTAIVEMCSGRIASWQRVASLR